MGLFGDVAGIAEDVGGAAAGAGRAAFSTARRRGRAALGQAAYTSLLPGGLGALLSDRRVRRLLGEAFTQVQRPRLEIGVPGTEDFGRVKLRLATTQESRQQYAQPVGVFGRALAGLSLPGAYGQEATAQVAEQAGASEGTLGAIRGRRASIIAQMAPFAFFGPEVAALSAAGSLAGGEVGAAVGGETGRTVGEVVGGVTLPLGPAVTRGVRAIAARGMATTAAEQAVPDLAARQRVLTDILQEKEINPLTGRPTQAPPKVKSPVRLRVEGEISAGKTPEELLDVVTGQIAREHVIPDPSADLRAGLEQSPKTPQVSGPGAAKLNSMFEPGIDPVQAAEAAMESRVTGSFWTHTGPVKAIINRISRAAAVKADSVDAMAINTQTQIEQFETSTGIMQDFLSTRQKGVGLLTETLDDVVEVGGRKTSLRRVLEYPDEFKLSPEQRAFVDEAHDHLQSVHRWGQQRLRDAGISDADIAKIMPETELAPGQRFIPRLATTVKGETVSIRPRRGVGAKQPNVAYERTIEHPPFAVQFSGDVGWATKAYADQVFRTVQFQTFVKPWAQRFRIPIENMVPPDFQADLSQQFINRDWLRRAQGIVKDANKGAATGRLRSRVSRLLGENVPGPYKAVLDRLDRTLAGGLAPGEIPRQARGLSRAAEKAAKAAAEREVIGSRGAPSVKPGESLAKAAEAAARAETTTGTIGTAKEFQAALRAASQATKQRLEAFAGSNALDLSRSQAMVKMAKRVIRTGFRPLDQRRFPGLAGDVFERHWAEQMEQAFARFDPPEGLLALASNLQADIVGLQAGSFDIGQVGLHMMPAWASQPWMLPALFIRGVTDDAYRAQLGRYSTTTFAKDATASKLQVMTNYGLRVGPSEALDPTQAIAQRGSALGKAGNVIRNLPLNKLFVRTINLARMSIADVNVKLVEAFKGRALNPGEYRQIMKVANTITGDFNWTSAGIGGTQRAVERVGLRYAPTWFRANMAWLVGAAQPSIGVEANLLRLHLATTVTAVVGIYSAMAYALGQAPNLDIRDRNFMSVKVGGIRVGPGGVIIGFVRTIGKAAELWQTGDKKAILDFTQGKNPMRQFWRSGAPHIGGLAYDMIANEGIQSFTQKDINPKRDPLGAARAIAEQTLMPFAAQDFAENGPTGFFATFMGGRAFPVSPAEMFLETADRKARTLGFKRWQDVPRATQADLLRKDNELKGAFDARTAYYDRFPSQQDKEEFVFGQIETSRQGMEDVLLASWRNVENGTMDISDFRQRFSEMSAQHGYLSNQLMDSLDGGLKERSNETKQDYYARLFHGIQPEQFDTNKDGTIDPSEWEAWREGRKLFWREFPEAGQFRNYITEDYPTRNWKSAEMAGIHRAKLTAQQQYDEFLGLPKYRGLSAEQGNFIDSVTGLADRKVREVQFALAQRGIDPSKVNIPAKFAWRLVLEDLKGSNLSADQFQLLRIAILLDTKPKARRALLSTERARFLMDNQDMASWYPSAFQDAGLRDREIALLGLAPAPLGQSVSERLAAAAA